MIEEQGTSARKTGSEYHGRQKSADLTTNSANKKKQIHGKATCKANYDTVCVRVKLIISVVWCSLDERRTRKRAFYVTNL